MNGRVNRGCCCRGERKLEEEALWKSAWGDGAMKEGEERAGVGGVGGVGKE